MAGLSIMDKKNGRAPLLHTHTTTSDAPPHPSCSHCCIRHRLLRACRDGWSPHCLSAPRWSAPTSRLLSPCPPLQPKACSGHGLCGANDECVCDPLYTGADCGQRSCPWGYAFVDTPRGDLNHDGRLDTGEAGFVDVQWSSAAEHEYFPFSSSPPATAKPYYVAADGEAHFWTECSGKGVCNRVAGECKCFSGYTGSSCQRSACGGGRGGTGGTSPLHTRAREGALCTTRAEDEGTLYTTRRAPLPTPATPARRSPLSGTCPNDCSGHGLCRTLREVASGARNTRKTQSYAGHSYLTGVVDPFDYNLWDADKKQVRQGAKGRALQPIALHHSRAGSQPAPLPRVAGPAAHLSSPLPLQVCLCDAGFQGIDCSERVCPRGADPLLNDDRWCGHTACMWEVQSFTLQKTGITTYRISLVDSTNTTHVALATVDTASNTFNGYVDPLSPSFASVLPDPSVTLAGQLMAALRATPAGLLQQVEIWPVAAVGTSPQDLTFRVTFVGIAGNQDLLRLDIYAGNGGLTCNPDHPSYAADTATGSCVDGAASRAVVRKVVGNRPETECAGRGNCDSMSGLCKCFTGFVGAACEHQNALMA